MSKIDRLRRCAPNTLDTVTGPDCLGNYRIEFKSIEGGSDAVILELRQGKALISTSSTCLPARGWLEFAEAYGRAAEFAHLMGFGDE